MSNMPNKKGTDSFLPMLGKIQKVHFVGIGGIGMSGIAEVLANLGFEVSGSDIKENSRTKHLRKLGCKIQIGHRETNVSGCDVVVISSAVTDKNIEVRKAKELKIPVIPRAEMLGELMRMKFSVAVAGSHGKTSTTSMIAVMMDRAELDPTIIIGGRLNTFGSNARLGQGHFLVAEADESDGSFLKLFPSIAIVTNIDFEHINFYKTFDKLKKTFINFINKVPFYGSAILCLDDQNVQSIIPYIKRRYITYGFSKSADVHVENLTMDRGLSTFDVFCGNEKIGKFQINLPGAHNVMNSLAVIATGLDLSIDTEIIKAALKEYKGVDRRFQLIGEISGIRVIDDYGHHPTEIQATLEAARALGPKRIIAIFQPHRYSRVKELWESFSTSFYNADILFCTPIYPAGEQPIEGITGKNLFDEIRSHGHKRSFYEEDFDSITQHVAEIASEGDIVITFGAGNINTIAYKIIEQLAAKEEK